MKSVLKLLGIVLIISVCAAFGFIKSNKLKRRYKKLLCFKDSVSMLKDRIRLSGGELERIIKESFSEYPVNYDYLEKSDSEILENLFSEIALSDKESAYNKCQLAYELLNQKYLEALNRYGELGKLYKSIGILGGVFLSILFL